MNTLIDIEKTKTEISEIKYPYIFLFLLISNKNSITDLNLSIILRLFLKYHNEIALTTNLKLLFQNELVNYKISWKVLSDFYKLVNKKLSLVFMLKKWYSIYQNKKFWTLSPKEQFEYIIDIKDKFLGIFDCSKNGTPYHHKLGALLKDNINSSEILVDVKLRLKMVLKLFGFKIFQALGIPVIDIYEFHSLSNEETIKYLFLIFNNLSNLLNQTIKIFQLHYLICIQLDSMFNPTIL